MEHKTFLARQPIMNRLGAVRAHELLFRESQANAVVVRDGFACTVAVIERAVSVFGTELMLGGGDGFLNCTGEFLFSDLVDVLPASQFVLEILRDEALTPELGARCDVLRQKGFRIALDEVSILTPEIEAFLPHVDIVKLSWPQIAPSEAASLVGAFKQAGRLVLAEKVERREAHALALEAGCDLFQGCYFSQPQMFVASSVPSHLGPVLKILKLLHDEAPDTEVEHELKHAPELVVNLLHLADSSDRTHARDSHISSIKQALATVGSRRLMRWCCLLLYGGKEGHEPDSDPLVHLVEQRAGFMERAAKELTPDQIEIHQAAYLTGMLSLIHIPHGIDARGFIARLPVSDGIRTAIVEHDGTLGALLKIAEFLETGHYQAALAQGRELGAGFYTTLALLAHWAGIAPSFDTQAPLSHA